MIAGSIENYLQEAVEGAWSALPTIMAGFGELFGTAIGLYFVMTLLSYMWTGQASQIPIMDLFKRFFFLALVCSIAFAGDVYIAWIKEPVLEIPNDIARLVSNTAGTTASTIDTMLSDNFQAVLDVWAIIGKVRFWNLSFLLILEVILTTLVILVLGTIYVVIAFAYLMVAKVLINVLLLIGPLFIMMAFFGITREYFMKWVGQILNYIFLVVIFTAVFALLNNVLSAVINNHEGSGVYIGGDGIGVDSLVLKFLFMYALFIAVIMAVPTLASSLTGGIGISPFGQVSQLVGGMKGGMAGMAKGLMGLGGKGAAGSIGKGLSKLG